jgi:hypothetical protein
MRNRVPVFMALVLVSAFVSALLWSQLRTAREELQVTQQDLQAAQQDLQTAQQDLQTAQQALQSEQQLADQLRGQLADARAQPMVAPPAPPAQLPTAPAILAALAARTTGGYASVASVGAQRDKIKLDDPEYHKAQLAMSRAEFKQRNPLFARELGISEEQADAILDVIAEGQMRDSAQQLELRASGKMDAAAMEEMKRQQEAQQQQDQDTLTAMLGPEKYGQLQEIQQTETAHVRMVNLKTLLAQSGQPLSTDQALSMTRVMVAAQQREEREMQQLRSSGQWDQVPEVDRAAEGDRRILDNASGILTAQQLDTVRAQFEKRQEMERATGMVTLRARGWGF